MADVTARMGAFDRDHEPLVIETDGVPPGPHQALARVPALGHCGVRRADDGWHAVLIQEGGDGMPRFIQRDVRWDGDELVVELVPCSSGEPRLPVRFSGLER